MNKEDVLNYKTTTTTATTTTTTINNYKYHLGFDLGLILNHSNTLSILYIRFIKIFSILIKRWGSWNIQNFMQKSSNLYWYEYVCKTWIGSNILRYGTDYIVMLFFPKCMVVIHLLELKIKDEKWKVKRKFLYCLWRWSSKVDNDKIDNLSLIYTCTINKIHNIIKYIY